MHKSVLLCDFDGVLYSLDSEFAAAYVNAATLEYGKIAAIDVGGNPRSFHKQLLLDNPGESIWSLAKKNYPEKYDDYVTAVFAAVDPAEHLTYNEALVEAFRRAKQQHGIEIAIFSNSLGEHISRTLPILLGDQHEELVPTTLRFGTDDIAYLAKPVAAAFAAIKTRLSSALNVEDPLITFIDDNEANVTAAEEAGLNGVFLGKTAGESGKVIYTTSSLVATLNWFDTVIENQQSYLAY